MKSDEIKKPSETALRMLEEERYLKDLEELSLLFDQKFDLDSTQEARFEELVTRVELHEDTYYPIGDPDEQD